MIYNTFVAFFFFLHELFRGIVEFLKCECNWTPWAGVMVTATLTETRHLLAMLFFALKYGRDEYDWPEPAANTSGAYAGRLIGAVSESLYGIVWSVKERLFTLVPVADMSVSETQGEKNNGFDVLYHNMKHGQISSKELTEFIRERWDGRVWCTLCLALVLCTLWPLSACSGLFSRRLWQSSSLYCVCSNTQILCWGNSLIHVTDNFRCACY